jgi:hypothetical protein
MLGKLKHLLLLTEIFRSRQKIIYKTQSSSRLVEFVNLANSSSVGLAKRIQHPRGTTGVGLAVSWIPAKNLPE